MRPDLVRLPRTALLQKPNKNDGMVGQVFADRRKIGADLDSKLAQRGRASDAGPHQQGRRMDAAQRHNDLAGEKLFQLTADPDAHTDGAAAFEQKAGHKGIADDLEIAAAPYRGIQIADCCRRALERPIAHRNRAVAVAEITVHVSDECDLPFLRESMRSFGELRPLFGFGAPDWDRSGFAVQRSSKIPVVLQLAEVWKNAVPTPSARAKRFPFGVVVRRAAMG